MLPEDELICMYFPWDDCCYLLLAFNVQIPLASNDDYSNEKGTNEKKKNDNNYERKTLCAAE